MTHRKISLFALLIVPLLLACQLTTAVSDLVSPTEEPTVAANTGELPFATSATPTPAPIGFSRANPHPPARNITLPNWEIEVQEFIRGDEAWTRLRDTNSNNLAPPEGQEYALLYLHLTNTGSSQNSESVSVGLTGERAVVYRSYLSNVARPEPWLETYLEAGQSSEGWAAFLLYEGEQNLLLALEDNTDYDIPMQFMALSFEASVPYTGDLLAKIEPTENGRSLETPAQFGQLVTAEDWQATVLNFKTGEEAWQQVYDANQFNDPPPKGMMYVTAYVRLRYIGSSDTMQFVTDTKFNIISRTGETFDQETIVNPDPELRGDLFSGGEAEGWVAFFAEETDPLNLLLLFEPDSNNQLYLSLVNTGR